jgi:hypothetical protein
MRRALAIAVLPLLLVGCGGGIGFDRGPERTEDRDVPAVTAVELATAGSLRLSTGDTTSLRITAGEHVLPYLTNEVSGDRLVLDAERFGDIGGVRYELVLPDARELELSGSGEIRVAEPSALTQVTLSGSGEVRVEGLDSDSLSVDLTGSGRIVVAGEVGQQSVSLDGSGVYDARGLQSGDADVTIGGSGTADVTVSGTLDAGIEGSGSISYGGGATVHTQIDGSGTVTAR